MPSISQLCFIFVLKVLNLTLSLCCQSSVRAGSKYTGVGVYLINIKKLYFKNVKNMFILYYIFISTCLGHSSLITKWLCFYLCIKKSIWLKCQHQPQKSSVAPALYTIISLVFLMCSLTRLQISLCGGSCQWHCR